VTQGGSALCFGDSGGAAYTTGADGSRVIFGVNSRGNIKDVSYLAAVMDTEFVSWAKTWAKASNNVKLCGIHSDAAYCKVSAAAPPSTGVQFEIPGPPACIRGVVSPNYADKKDAIVQGIVDSLKNY
jgi:hypothetical protein